MPFKEIAAALKVPLGTALARGTGGWGTCGKAGRRGLPPAVTEEQIDE